MSSSWEPYNTTTNTSISNANNPNITTSAGLSPMAAVASNGPGGVVVTHSQTDLPRGSANTSIIHQPLLPVYSAPGVSTYPPNSNNNPYAHPQHHQHPPNPSYPPSGTPPVIHPYPPLTTSGGAIITHPPYNHNSISQHPHHGPPPNFQNLPPPPYPVPQHGIPPPTQLSPTHTTTTGATLLQQQQQLSTPPGPGGIIHHGPSTPPQNPHPHPAGPFNLKTPPGPGGPVPLQHNVGPVPQTPLGPPGVGNPFNQNGPEMDLHPELVAIGWRKFWSKRENRWYFWNCNSGESLWEVPPLPGRHHPPAPGQPGFDIISDPLGIQCANNGPAQMAGIKRRSSSGEHLGSPTIKKFILAGPWDLEISSTAYSSESAIPNPNLLPPHPDVELMRYQLVVKLRQCYQQSCQSREGIDAPKESMNRWFMERKLHDRKGIDPIFPSCGESEGVVSQAMYKEIMNDIPMKVIKPRFTGDARKQLSKFAEACKKIIETRNATAEARKLVKWKVEETFSWLRSTSGAPFEAFQERLVHLKVTCQPHVHIAAKSSVEGICKKMSVLSQQYAANVRETHMKLFVDPDNVKQDTTPETGKFRCHPAVCGPYSFTDTGKLPSIEFMQQDRDHVLLKYKADVVRLTTQYLQKLEQLYRYNCVDDRKFEFFLARCYCLMKRYNGYCEDFSLPHNNQGSLPVTVFESIQRNFGVSFECFASPLNCYFRQYCSAFGDTDGYFGSRGTFLDFKPATGSFQVNPPFSEDLIDASITHIEDLLGASKEPLSFIMIVPEHEKETEESEIECNWLKRLENSRWKRKQVTIPPFEHEFRHGAQHLVSKSEVCIRSTNATVVFWLQNDSGFEEYKPTEQKVDSLIEAYRPGRERERDRQDLLAPERKNPHKEDKAQAAAMVSNSMTPAAI